VNSRTFSPAQSSIVMFAAGSASLSWRRSEARPNSTRHRLGARCRDPKDDKFLELALNGRADAIITGDADLLALHPWREVAIVSPADYLRR